MGYAGFLSPCPSFIGKNCAACCATFFVILTEHTMEAPNQNHRRYCGLRLRKRSGFWSIFNFRLMYIIKVNFSFNGTITIITRLSLSGRLGNIVAIWQIACDILLQKQGPSEMMSPCHWWKGSQNFYQNVHQVPPKEAIWEAKCASGRVFFWSPGSLIHLLSNMTGVCDYTFNFMFGSWCACLFTY